MRVFVPDGTGGALHSTVPAVVVASNTVTAHARLGIVVDRLHETGISLASLYVNDHPISERGALRSQDLLIDHRATIPSTVFASLLGARQTFVYLRDEVTTQLVDTMLGVGGPRLIQDLATFAYDDSGKHRTDDEAPAADSGTMATNLFCEHHISELSSANWAGLVPSFGVLYGPDGVISAKTACHADLHRTRRLRTGIQRPHHPVRTAVGAHVTPSGTGWPVYCYVKQTSYNEGAYLPFGSSEVCGPAPPPRQDGQKEGTL